MLLAKKLFLLSILSCSLIFLFPNISFAESPAGQAQKAYNSGSSVNELQQLTGKPTNRITIPGLQYSDIKQVDSGDTTYLYIPFIGEYLSTVYKYLIIFAGIVAVIVIIVAGIQWTASGGNSSTIESAKNRITGALTGLGLAVGSYVILYAINPELVSFRSLKVQYIKGESIESLEFLSSGDYQSLTGHAPLPPEEIIKKAIEVTKQVGLDDPCYMIAIMGKESGGNPAAIGHDENYPRKTCVGSRKDFLVSGIKFSQETFPSPVKSAREYNCERDNPTKDANGKLLMNDDRFNPSAPPDYGLDWRFTHGFGLGQITLKGDYYCDGQRGIVKSGKCFTIPQLLTVDAAAFTAASLFKSNLDCAQKKGYTGDKKIQAAFWAYAAGCGKVIVSNGQDISNAPGVPRAWEHFQSCKSDASKFGAADPTGAADEEASP